MNEQVLRKNVEIILNSKVNIKIAISSWREYIVYIEKRINGYSNQVSVSYYRGEDKFNTLNCWKHSDYDCIGSKYMLFDILEWLRENEWKLRITKKWL